MLFKLCMISGSKLWYLSCRHLCMFQVWERTLSQHKEVQSLFSMASLHRNCKSGQCVQASWIPFCPESILCQVWKWSWTWVSEWRPKERRITLLNILLLSFLSWEGERGGKCREGGCKWEIEQEKQAPIFRQSKNIFYELSFCCLANLCNNLLRILCVVRVAFEAVGLNPVWDVL